ncbi:MAG: hypothetical protein WD273_12195 [Trueperaceae bacterium]
MACRHPRGEFLSQLIGQGTISGDDRTFGQYVDALAQEILELLELPTISFDEEKSVFVKHYLVGLKLDYERAVACGWFEKLPGIVGDLSSLLHEIGTTVKSSCRIAA